LGANEPNNDLHLANIDPINLLDKVCCHVAFVMENPSIKASRCNLENFINQGDFISCCIFALQNETVNEQKGDKGEFPLSKLHQFGADRAHMMVHRKIKGQSCSTVPATASIPSWILHPTKNWIPTSLSYPDQTVNFSCCCGTRNLFLVQFLASNPVSSRHILYRSVQHLPFHNLFGIAISHSPFQFANLPL